MASPPLPPYPGTCVPYAQATPRQLSLALTYAMEELAQHFPTLSFPAWANGLLQEHPDLWVEGEQVYLDDEDLARLVQRLAGSPELPQLSPPVYPDEACYLARRVREFQRRAQAVLAELEANPAAYGANLCGLVCDLADGDATAERVYRLTHRQVAPRPGSPDPAVARQALLARLEALRYYPLPGFQG